MTNGFGRKWQKRHAQLPTKADYTVDVDNYMKHIEAMSHSLVKKLDYNVCRSWRENSNQSVMSLR